MYDSINHVIFLNIGSNIENRRLNISRAVAAIEKEFGYFEISHVIESKPLGFDSGNDFLNVGMMIRSELSPADLLKKLKGIERSISSESHRNEDGTFRDRIIDIDIIAIDDLVIQSEELILPHPRMHERTFVLEPMLELAPGWIHPVLKASPAQLLEKLT